MDITTRISNWFGDYARDQHSRYRSWEHCYGHFQGEQPEGISQRANDAALQLGFYLASWGMYRGSSFLLRYAYTVHLPVIDALTRPRFTPLWKTEFGAENADYQRVQLVLDLVQSIRAAYGQYGQPTDTLVTKVLLGTLGSLPACDRYFVEGFKSEGFSFSCLNRRFVERVLEFSLLNLESLRREQDRIRQRGGIRYPLMKLVDMYFHAMGWEPVDADA